VFVISLSLLLVELNDENDVLDEDDGVKTLIIFEADEAEDDTEDWSLLEVSLKLALYFCQGLMGDTRVSLK